MNNDDVKNFASKINRSISERYKATVFEISPDFLTLKTYKLKPINTILEKYVKTTIRITGKTGKYAVYLADEKSSRLIVNDISVPSLSISTCINALEHAGYFNYLEYSFLVASVDEELAQYRNHLTQVNNNMLGRKKLLAAK